MDPEKITYFAKADFRNKMTPFGIKAIDRTRHVYVIGKTGMGKSTLLENMVVQDIQSGNGCAFIDPHGGTAELLLEYIPEDRINDVIYFAPFDTDYPVAFNVMEDVGKDKRHLVASGLMSAFKKIWVDAWSARMEYILGNTLLALLEFPGATLLGVNRMYTDKDYRKKVVDNITDPSIKSFWVDEYAKYGERYTQEATPAIQNKIGQFVSNPLIRNIIGQAKSTFDIRDVMDSKKILIMNLSKGRVGDQNTSLLGSMLITKIYLAAMSRADVTRQEMAALPFFYFFVDEFQSFANESFADILSEARKYKLNLTIAHQYIEQMPEEVRAAVFGNVGTMITFRVGSYDAEVLEKEFLPAFTAEDIVNLDKYQLYLRLMIDGVGSRPFSAVALPPIKKSEVSSRDRILENSRRIFARKKEDVEKEIMEWHHTSFADKKPAPTPVAADGAGSSQSSTNFVPTNNNYQGSIPRLQGQSYRPAGTPSAGNFTPNTPRPPFVPRENPITPQTAFTPRENPTPRPAFVPRENPSSVPPTQREPLPTQNNRQPFNRNVPNQERRSTLPPRVVVQNTATVTPSVQTQTTPKPATISLSALRKDTSRMPEQTQNRNSLKEALQSILPPKEEIPKSPTVQEIKPKIETPVISLPPTSNVVVTQAEDTKPSTSPLPVNSSSQQELPKVKEIPEDVLRGMLKVEE